MMSGVEQKMIRPSTMKSSKKSSLPVSTGDGGTKPITKVKRQPKIPIHEMIHIPILPNGTL